MANKPQHSTLHNTQPTNPLHLIWPELGYYPCNRCKKQTSLTAGTIFHSTKLPLAMWFAAIHLIVTAKNGISSVKLGRRLGVGQPTAWTMKEKIMAVMARREEDKPLSGRVEMDDAWLGGVRSGGKRSRARPARRRSWPPSRPVRAGSRRAAARTASFKWVNITLGNIKGAVTGTYRKLGPDHAERYLVNFAWRYNRGYQLQTMILFSCTVPPAHNPSHTDISSSDEFCAQERNRNLN